MFNKAYKVRLYPTQEQAQLINQTIGNSRFIYNQMLEERIQVYEKLKDDREKLYAYKYKTEKEYKQEFEFLKLGSSRALQQSRGNLDTAYQNFYTGLKKGKKVGFPQFKKRSTSKLSYREPQVSNQIEIKDNKIKLLKLSWVKFRGLPESFKGKIKNVTVSKDRDGKYYASILTEHQTQEKKLRSGIGVAGIDLGLKTFATISNNEQYQGIFSEFKKITSKIKSLQKHFSRKQKGSKRKEKARIKLAGLYKYRTNLQNHFFWNLANQLCSKNQALVIEDLNIKGMTKNKKLARAIQDASWGKFLTILKQKAVEYGTDIQQVGRFFPSSKTCSCCGAIKSDLKLSDRIFKCDCGFEIDRDLNASVNLKNVFFKKSGEFSDYSRGEIIRPAQVIFDLSGKFLRSDDLVYG